jgi:NAD(P)-dependent dehydrogenase (short-subunit alcohol dehydrogenase family)
MTKFIVVTGASKGIGRAAVDALVDARTSPRYFPGAFIETDLADRGQTQALADHLAAHGGVLGIVNNVGLSGVRDGHGLECASGTATHPGAIA